MLHLFYSRIKRTTQNTLYQWSAPVFEQKILTMHLIKEKLLFMEVSIICSSFIYGERHEERLSGVGGGGGGGGGKKTVI